MTTPNNQSICANCGGIKSLHPFEFFNDDTHKWEVCNCLKPQPPTQDPNIPCPKCGKEYVMHFSETGEYQIGDCDYFHHPAPKQSTNEGGLMKGDSIYQACIDSRLDEQEPKATEPDAKGASLTKEETELVKSLYLLYEQIERCGNCCKCEKCSRLDEVGDTNVKIADSLWEKVNKHYNVKDTTQLQAAIERVEKEIHIYEESFLCRKIEKDLHLILDAAKKQI